MAGWLPVAVRFALYLDLGLAFGWPLYCLYGLKRGQRHPGAEIRPAPMLWLGIAGVLLSALGFAVQLATMAGTSVLEVDPSLVDTMIRETAVGWAFSARMIALLLMVLIAVAAPRRWRAGLAALAGAVALGSLAWNGHAGAAEGRFATIQLGADLLHLLSAGLWLGALFGLLAMATRRSLDESQLAAAHQALEVFSTVGTVVVATLIATGVTNSLLIVGRPDLPALLDALWSRLLLAKLLLFVMMLALAAANRFRLTPALRLSLTEGNSDQAVARLRASLALETATAVVILGLVAWLGMLAPPGSA